MNVHVPLFYTEMTIPPSTRVSFLGTKQKKSPFVVQVDQTTIAKKLHVSLEMVA